MGQRVLRHAGCKVTTGGPRWVTLLQALAWGTLVLEALKSVNLARRVRLPLVLLIALLAVGELVWDPTSGRVFGLSALQCGLAFLAGRWRDDRLLRHLALLALALGAAGHAARGLDYSDIRVGLLFIRLGFFALVLAVPGAAFGATLRRHVGEWWRSLG